MKELSIDTFQKLEEALRSNPITEKSIDELRMLDYEIVIDNGYSSSQGFSSPRHSFPRYITLGRDDDINERNITLMHEIIHQTYNIYGVSTALEIEDRIDEEAKRLVVERPKLVNYVFSTFPVRVRS